jgi:hypothetical protein
LLNALRVDKGLKLPDLNDDNILVFRKSKKRYDKWENSFLQQYSAKVAKAFEVSKRQRSAILALSFCDLEELVNIKPEPGSCYVLPLSLSMRKWRSTLRSSLTGLPTTVCRSILFMVVGTLCRFN